MRAVGKVSPALFRRAFFLGGVLWQAAVFAAAPAGPRPELAQVGKPTPEEAARLVEQFRGSGIPGDHYLEFELRQLPRRGEGPTFKGRWWGSRNDQGAVTRIELLDTPAGPQRLLLQNGEQAKVWRLQDGRAVEVGVAEWMAPLIPGVEISAFDLQMPYLYWPGAGVEKITRSVLGRPAYLFVFPAPAAFRAQFAGIGSSRAYFDAQFNVPMQTEVLDATGKVTRTLALLSLQTVNKQTLPKAADYRNEVTRDKTRLLITGVALGLDLPDTVFRPAQLADPAAAPAAGQIVRVTP